MNKFLAAMLITTSLGATAYAQSPEGPQGFSARIEAGALFVSTTDQLFAYGERNIDNLDDSADRGGAVLPVVLFDLRYRSSESGTEVFLGTPLETDAMGLTLGVGHSLGSLGTAELAAIASPWSEVWDDPYRVNGKRDRTWARQYGLKAGLQGVAGTGVSLGYTGVHTDVVDDDAGARFDALRRDGWSHEFSLGYRMPVGPGLFLAPEVAAVVGDLDGDAESFRGYQGKLGCMMVRERVMLQLAVEGGWTRYGADNPMFGERREEGTLGGSAMATLPGLFGVPGMYANVVGTYGVRNANLDFFDARTAVGIVTVGYEL